MNARCYFVLGTRPEIVKLSTVIGLWKGRGMECLIVHSGQHYDSNMDRQFFLDLALPTPDVNLAIGSGSHATQTSKVLEGVEETLIEHGPGIVVVEGDTNTTLGAALGASQTHRTPVVHVEAGCRSFNRVMPEEINRVVVDHVSDVLFAATKHDMRNLQQEGLADRAKLVGSTGTEACLRNAPKAVDRSRVLERFRLRKGHFALATVHRDENTSDVRTLRRILDGLGEVAKLLPVLFPVHPRTQAASERYSLEWPDRVVRTPPLGYLDFLAALAGARLVLTDSGGVQEEAAFLGTRCFTLRGETEWLFTLEAGVNSIVGTDPLEIRRAVQDYVDRGSEVAPVLPDWPDGVAPSHAIARELGRFGAK